jgi:hypothetical protein
LVGLGDCKKRNSAIRRKAVDDEEEEEEEEEDDDGGRGQGGYPSQSSARVFKVPMILVL